MMKEKSPVYLSTQCYTPWHLTSNFKAPGVGTRDIIYHTNLSLFLDSLIETMQQSGLTTTVNYTTFPEVYQKQDFDEDTESLVRHIIISIRKQL